MALNPVERRMLLLCNDWIEFRDDPNARVLIWQVPENALRMVECFIEAQKQESEYTAGDLFLLLKTPYRHGMQYARGLKDTLRGQYDASAEAMQREGLPVDWSFDPADSPNSPAGFAMALRSFGSRYHQAMGHLVATLMPLSVSKPEAHVAFIDGLLAADMPERLRVLLVDTFEFPRWAPMAGRGDPRVRLTQPAVDALATAQEAFAQETTTGPGGVFRNLLMGVVTLIEKGTADQVKAKATDALAFARKQQWADQEVVVRMMVAGAFLKESRHAEAVRAYQGARQAADVTVTAGHPAGLKLVLQALIGEAGAHFAAGDDDAAAGCYDEAAIVAQRDGDAMMTIESFRMAAFCKARAGDRRGALERGQCALAMGTRLAPDACAMTTLPIAAVDMLRVIDPERLLRMQQVKADLRARDDAAVRHAEASGARLAAQGGPQGLEAVEAALEQAQDAAAAEAEASLAQLVAEAAKPFAEVVAQADALLPARWLVDNDIALRVPVPPAPVEGSAP